MLRIIFITILYDYIYGLKCNHVVIFISTWTLSGTLLIKNTGYVASGHRSAYHILHKTVSMHLASKICCDLEHRHDLWFRFY